MFCRMFYFQFIRWYISRYGAANGTNWSSFRAGFCMNGQATGGRTRKGAAHWVQKLVKDWPFVVAWLHPDARSVEKLVVYHVPSIRTSAKLWDGDWPRAGTTRPWDLHACVMACQSRSSVRQPRGVSFCWFNGLFVGWASQAMISRAIADAGPVSRAAACTGVSNSSSWEIGFCWCVELKCCGLDDDTLNAFGIEGIGHVNKNAITRSRFNLSQHDTQQHANAQWTLQSAKISF